MEYIPVIIILLIGIIGGRWCSNCEKKVWNNGICPETGLKWKLYDRSSQGWRGYNSGGHHIWISYNVDK